MSDDSELDKTLQKAILNLHDVKPKDPIRFLADYFSFECENDPFATSINLFDSLTIFHPTIEERIAKCYHILSSLNEFQGVLIGDRYNRFNKQLLIRLHVSLELRKAIMDYLYRENSSIISYHILRRAILTVLLYNHYFEEMLFVFDKFIRSFDVAPKYRCQDLLIHARICLRSIRDTFKEYPYTLGIRKFCDPEYKGFRSSSKDSTEIEFWNRKNFMIAAIETFFQEIDDLSLSQNRLFDPMNSGHENEYSEDEQDELKDEQDEEEKDEDEHDEHEQDEEEYDEDKQDEDEYNEDDYDINEQKYESNGGR